MHFICLSLGELVDLHTLLGGGEVLVTPCGLGEKFWFFVVQDATLRESLPLPRGKCSLPGAVRLKSRIVNLASPMLPLPPPC